MNFPPETAVLDLLSVASLRVLGQSWNLPQTSRPELMVALARGLRNRQLLRLQVESLPQEDRAIFTYLKRRGGWSRVAGLRQALITNNVRSPDAVIHRCMVRGLLHYLPNTYAGFPLSYLDTSKRDLYGLKPEPATLHYPLFAYPEVLELAGEDTTFGLQPLKPAKSPDANAILPDLSENLRHDLYVLARYVQENNVRLLQNGEISRRDWIKINAILSRQENIEQVQYLSQSPWASFVLLLLNALRLVWPEAGALVAGKSLTGFFAAPDQDERLFISFQDLRWETMTSVTGLLQSYSIDRSDYPSPEQEQIARRRLFALLPSIARAGVWYKVEDLLCSVRAYDVEILIPRHGPPARYYWHSQEERDRPIYDGLIIRDLLGKDGRPRTLYMDSDWNEVEGRWLRYLLFEPLRWLGLVELAIQPDSDPSTAGSLPRQERQGREITGLDLVAFRFTERAIPALKLTAEQPRDQSSVPVSSPATSSQLNSAHQSRLVVQPNFEMVVIHGALTDYALLSRLEDFAERVQFDRVATFRLTEASIYKALRAGLTIDQIIDFLTGASGEPLPQNVRYTLMEWAGRYERITIYLQATLLEMDARNLDDLLAHPGASQLITTRLSPTFALVRAGAESALVNFLPGGDVRVARLDHVAPRRHAFSLHQFEITLHNLYPDPVLNYQLRSIAVPVEGKAKPTFRLDPDLLAAAPPGRWTFDNLVAFLNTGTGKPLPPEILIWLKGWTGVFGATVLDNMPSLVTQNGDDLDELLSIDKIQDALLVKLGPQVALLDPTKMDQVRETVKALRLPTRTFAESATKVQSLLKKAAKKTTLTSRRRW